jgi:hypothetical protein
MMPKGIMFMMLWHNSFGSFLTSESMSRQCHLKVFRQDNEINIRHIKKNGIITLNCLFIQQPI